MEETEGFLKKGNVFAVVGVSRDRNKYGRKVYEDLKAAGYRAYPVNPNVDSIGEDRCFRSLKELPEKPDVVSIVVPPEAALGVLEECASMGITRVWMQPGSESDDAIGFCREHGMEVLHGMCIMVKRKGR